LGLHLEVVSDFLDYFYDEGSKEKSRKIIFRSSGFFLSNLEASDLTATQAEIATVALFPA
jgi:hypothetical protein